MIIRIVVDIVHNFDYLHIIDRAQLLYHSSPAYRLRPIPICLDQSPSFSEISNIFLIGLMAFFCTSSSTNISGISNFKQLYSMDLVTKDDIPNINKLISNLYHIPLSDSDYSDRRRVDNSCRNTYGKRYYCSIFHISYIPLTSVHRMSTLFYICLLYTSRLITVSCNGKCFL